MKNKFAKKKEELFENSNGLDFREFFEINEKEEQYNIESKNQDPFFDNAFCGFNFYDPELNSKKSDDKELEIKHNIRLSPKCKTDSKDCDQDHDYNNQYSNINLSYNYSESNTFDLNIIASEMLDDSEIKNSCDYTSVQESENSSCYKIEHFPNCTTVSKNHLSKQQKQRETEFIKPVKISSYHMSKFNENENNNFNKKDKISKNEMPLKGAKEISKIDLIKIPLKELIDSIMISEVDTSNCTINFRNS